MPRTSPANAQALSDDAAGFMVLDRALESAMQTLGHARLVAGALDASLIETPECDTAAAIALNISGADAQLASARKLVADLQARRIEIARSCAMMRAALERK
jgi:hypothetical protein